MDQPTLIDVGERAPASPTPARDPRTVVCPYKGHRYAPPCRAQPGQPCRDGQGLPASWFHAERRAAAGEHVPTYEELFGREAATPDEGTEEPPAEDGEESDDP